MTNVYATEYGFAATHDVPIPYLPRIREYYHTLAYGVPYEWAHYAEVPFHPLTTPLSQSRIALITTAAPYQPGKGDQGPAAPYNAKAKFYAVYSGDTAQDHDLRISHIAIDRKHTTAEDSATYFPLTELRQSFAEEGVRRPNRVCCPAFSWCPDQSQPSCNAQNRFSGDRRPLQGRRSRCGDSDSQLPGLPPDRQPRRAHAGGERHLHHRHGLREGYRRVCRCAAFSVL